MTNKKVAVSIAYVAVFVQLATYVANDTGTLSKGHLYWSLLYGSGITLLVALLWLVRLRRHPRHSRETR